MIQMYRICVSIFGLLAVVACTPQSTTPIKSLSLLDGAVTTTAPAGYCIDQVSSKPARGFAVIAPCVNLGGSDAAPDAVGVATIQVGPAGSAALTDGPDDLRDLLTTQSGAVLLSAVGNADTVKILSAETEDDSVVVNFSDSAPAPLKGLAAEEWRAFFDLNGRLVTVAVRGIAENELEDGAGAWLLDLVVTGLLPG